MKKICFLIFFSILLLCGCERRPDHYVYINSVEEIDYIELIENLNCEGQPGRGKNEKYFHVLTVLESEMAESFMKDIYQLTSKERIGGPLYGFGEYVARVVYKNGDIEMLGAWNIEYVPAGEEITGFSSYYFSYDDFVAIFEKYIVLTLQ